MVICDTEPQSKPIRLIIRKVHKYHPVEKCKMIKLSTVLVRSWVHLPNLLLMVEYSRAFERSCDKTSARLVNRGPRELGQYHGCCWRGFLERHVLSRHGVSNVVHASPRLPRGRISSTLRWWGPILNANAYLYFSKNARKLRIEIMIALPSHFIARVNFHGVFWLHLVQWTLGIKQKSQDAMRLENICSCILKQRTLLQRWWKLEIYCYMCLGEDSYHYLQFTSLRIYQGRGTVLSLIRIMAYYPIGTKLLSERMVTFSAEPLVIYFPLKKMYLKVSSTKCRSFCFEPSLLILLIATKCFESSDFRMDVLLSEDLNFFNIKKLWTLLFTGQVHSLRKYQVSIMRHL